jgi:osmoprotectant transport system permease protein
MRYLFAHPDDVALRLAQHAALTASALVIALAIAVPLGVAASRNARVKNVVFAFFGAIYTIPSLAVFALLIPVLGLGFVTALVALVAYGQMILVRNVTAGLEGVPQALKDAARGLGMSGIQAFWRVELPCAFPVVLGGIRLTTVALVSMATLAAWIDAGGLGALVFAGIQRDQPDKIFAGTIPLVLLAIGADVTLRALERRATRQLAGAR